VTKKSYFLEARNHLYNILKRFGTDIYGIKRLKVKTVITSVRVLHKSKEKVKQSRYRPGVAQRIPGS
jgi:hypothetical protein